MKAKKILTFSVTILVASLMIVSACKKEDNGDNNNSDCNSYVSATSSGFVAQDFCFDQLVEYNFNAGQTVALTVNQQGDPIYSCMVQIGTTNDPFTGPGTYQCGGDEAGYVELIIHGTENEFYKTVSGTITVTEASENTFKATFNVTLKGYNNGETVTLNGTVKY